MKRTHIKGLFILLIIGAFGLYAQRPTAGAETALPEDIQISHAVDDELMEDPAVMADRIDVSTDEGIVQLDGAVHHILARDRAVAIAETIKGVRGIVNRIVVAPPPRADRAIRKDVEDALASDPATEEWEITADVDDGVVSLNGEVQSWQEMEIALQVAKGVKGVQEVENHLRIDYTTERPDREIREEAEGALRWSAYVDDALIDVEVKNGHVTLSGTVGSLAEKSHARDAAWVAGVESVDYDRLDVKWWTRDDRLREDKYVKKTARELETAVKDALRYDPRVNAFDIEPEAQAGYVTLRGTVDNIKAKRAAAQDARNIVGVWAIDNKIKVRPRPTADGLIERRVEEALLRDPNIERYRIDVDVNDGIVSLYGTVDSTYEKSLADDAAARQAGVRDIRNFLTVNRRAETVYNPHTDDIYLYDYNWLTVPENRPLNKTDWEIAEDINREMFWSPFVESDEINLSVQDGVATLEGTVDSIGESRAAVENAKEGGAVQVRNRLKIEYGPRTFNF